MLGSLDLTLLIVVFIALQAWWIIPLIMKNNNLNESGKELKEEVKKLEELYKK